MALLVKLWTKKTNVGVHLMSKLSSLSTDNMKTFVSRTARCHLYPGKSMWLVLRQFIIMDRAV